MPESAGVLDWTFFFAATGAAPAVPATRTRTKTHPTMRLLKILRTITPPPFSAQYRHRARMRPDNRQHWALIERRVTAAPGRPRLPPARSRILPPHTRGI